MRETELSYSPLSSQSAAGLPNEQLASSTESRWTSLLLERHGSSGRSDPFDVAATPDLTIVVGLRGDHDLEVWRSGRWQKVIKRAGSVSATPPGEACRLRWRGHGPQAAFETAHLYIPGDIVAETIEHYRRAGQRFRARPWCVLAERDALLMHAVSALLGAMQSDAPDLYAETTARWIALHMLCRSVVRDPRAPRWGELRVLNDRRLARVLELMTCHFAEPLSLDRLAAEANISKFHFARTFRERTGQSPASYLVDLRMDAARRLLENSDTPIAEVATRCGYGRANNFSTAFVRRFGVTPYAYRRQHQAQGG